MKKVKIKWSGSQKLGNAILKALEQQQEGDMRG